MENNKDSLLYTLGCILFIITILFIMWLAFPFLRETGNPIIDMGNSVRRGFMSAIRNHLVYIELILIFIYHLVWEKQ